MGKSADNLKEIVLDAMTEFYQEYIKPETRRMVEEVLDEKLEEKLDEKFKEELAPIKQSLKNIEARVNIALGDSQETRVQVDDHEKRITNLEQTTP